MPQSSPKPPEKVRVRTTMRPWEEIEVPADEAEVLRRQGLLAEDDAKDIAKDEAPATGASTKAAKPAAGKDA